MCTKYLEFGIKQPVVNDMLLKAKATKKFKPEETVTMTQRVPESEKDEKTLERTKKNNRIQQEPTWRLVLHLMF